MVQKFTSKGGGEGAGAMPPVCGVILVLRSLNIKDTAAADAKQALLSISELNITAPSVRQSVLTPQSVISFFEDDAVT